MPSSFGFAFVFCTKTTGHTFNVIINLGVDDFFESK